MFYTNSRSLKNRARALLVFGILIMISAGCASGTGGSGTASDTEVTGERIITSIETSDEVAAVKINIQGNTLLTYTSVKQSLPLGIVLYFPGTKLENIDSEYSSESSIYSSIKTSQQSHDSGFDSRVKILLNKDVDYTVQREGNGLQISLAKPDVDEAVSDSEAVVMSEEDDLIDDDTEYDDELEAFNEQDIGLDDDLALSSDSGAAVAAGAAIAGGAIVAEEGSGAEEEVIAFESGEELTEEVLDESTIYDEEVIDDYGVTEDYETEDIAVATAVASVDQKITEDGFELYINADGKIENFKTFTIPSNDQKSARIVCDIFAAKGLKTQGEQIIPVNSNGVKSVRYFSSPEKMRLVIDTNNDNLTLYSASAVSSGLKITVGSTTGLSESDEVLDEESVDIDLTESVEDELLDETASSVQGAAVAADATGAVAAGATGAVVAYGVEGENEEMLAEDAASVDDVYNENNEMLTEDTASAGEVYGESDEMGEEPISTTEDTYIPEETAIVTEEPVLMEEETQMSDSVDETVAMPASGNSWVNRIDFTSEAGGKSTFIIGTTQAADYKVTKKDEKTIHLRLNNVTLPKNRQRPLITTRFESAVNRILPVQTDEMKMTALFIIELREPVPYFVDQQNGVLKLNFEASSIPPLPEDLAQLPLWKETLSKTPEIKEIEMEAALDAPESEILSAEIAPEDTAIVEGEEQLDSGEEIEVVEDQVESGEEIEIVEGQVEPGEEIEVAETDAKSPEAETVIPVPEETDSELLSEQGIEDISKEEIEDLDEEMSISGDGSFVSWARKKKYTGEKISVDFFETDIKNVLRIIRAVSGQNFAIDKDVTGKVTMTLDTPVPWDQVLDLVLKMNMLGLVSEGGIHRVATLETLRLEEEKRLEYIAAEEKTKVKKKSLEPLFTEYILINYSNASSEVKPLVESVITPERGKLSVDTRTNQIILTDTLEKINEVKKLIKKLDKMTPQVIIEARIVEATTSFSRNLGSVWGLNSNPNYDVYNDTLGGTYGYDVAMNHTVAADSSFGINFTKLTGSQFLLNAKLLAMESQGEGKIVSAPKLITLDNKEATITQGVEYPYTVYNDGEASTSFKKIELKLTVTPHVTADKKISLKVVIDKNDIATLTDDGPALSTRKIETELLISDGDTIVIGGIIKSTKNSNVTGIPLLKDIPWLGWLFKAKTRTSEKQELLIFLSPRIVNFEDSLR